MALSDQLTRLAARAKEAEVHAADAKAKAKADLEKDVTAAGESAQAQADALTAAVDEHTAEVSEWWGSVQRSWSDHTAAIRQNIGQKRAAHDLKTGQRNAEQAESDAAFAIDYAYGAVEEAEFAVLNAVLARMDADEMARA
jgi:hypothetical protein